MKNKNIALFAIVLAIVGLLSSNSESFAQLSNVNIQINQGGVVEKSNPQINQGGVVEKSNLNGGNSSINGSGSSIGLQANNFQNNSAIFQKGIPHGSTGFQASQGNMIGGIVANATNGSQTVIIAAGVGWGGANGTCVRANNCFNPQIISINSGATVTWMNNDNVVHTVTSGKSNSTVVGKLFDKNIPPGKSVSIQFSTGTIDYFCKIHPWMSGQVIVGPGSGNSSNTQGGIKSSNSTVSTNDGMSNHSSLGSSSLTLGNGSSNGRPSPSVNSGNNGLH